jgi:hypothetical protein
MKSKCRIKLSGHEFDLKKATEYFKTDHFSIAKIEDEYFICSNNFNDTKDTNIISKIADDYIEKINGILKLKFKSYNPITLDQLFVFEDENGTSKIAAMSAVIKGRGDLTANTINSAEELENKKLATEVLLNNSVASEVFHFYSQSTTWINLYKIYEIIKDNIGQKNVEAILTDKQLSRFTGTAQSKLQIGDEARHAAKKFIGHIDPMTINEANELIRKLILVWAESTL